MKRRSSIFNIEFLETRTLRSQVAAGAITEARQGQRGGNSALTLQLKGVMQAGFPFRGTPHPGSPIGGLILGGRPQTLIANGIKVQSGEVDCATGTPVAVYGGPSHIEFSSSSTMTLETRKGAPDPRPDARGGGR